MPRSVEPGNLEQTPDYEDLNFQDKLDSRPARKTNFIQDLAEPLKWIGFALLGIYASTVVADALPVKLMDPVWISKICGSIRGGVSFPLLAMALILIGAYLERTGNEPPLITRLRRFCSWVALGFVLMIPLQFWSGQKLIGLAIQNQQARVQPGEMALKALYAATNADELQAAIRSIPGAPPNISNRFDEPVRTIRDRLIAEIEPQLDKQKDQIRGVTGEIRRDSVIGLVRDAIVALLSALAFAALGRSKSNRPTLLQKLLRPTKMSGAQLDEYERFANANEKT
jgi:hypothetical protein